MKKLYTLIIILALLPFVGLAQSTFAPLGAYWNYYYSGSGTDYNSFETIKVVKDTLIDGFPTKFLKKTYQVTHSFPPSEPTGTVGEVDFGAIQLRNDSVFQFSPDDPGLNTLLFAFNLNVNDTLFLYQSGLIAVVDSVYFTVINNDTLTVWELSKFCNNDPVGNSKIIEKIGLVDDYLFWNTGNCPMGTGTWDFQCYGSQDLTINEPCYPISLDIKVQEPDMLTIFPNPASGFINIKSRLVITNATIEVTDLHGRVIYSENHKNLSSETINIQRFEPGIFTLVLRSDAGIITRQMIKVE